MPETTFENATLRLLIEDEDGIVTTASLQQTDSSGGGGIGGSIADKQIAFGSGTDIAGTDSLKWENDSLIIDGGDVSAGSFTLDGAVEALVAPNNHTIDIGDPSNGVGIQIDLTATIFLTNNIADSSIQVSLNGGSFSIGGGPLWLSPQADPPGSPAEGMIYADTDHHLYYYNGTTWKQLDN